MSCSSVNLIRAAGCLCAALCGAAAQPLVNSVNPIVNSASYMAPGMPSAGIAQGSIFTIFGTGLGEVAWHNPDTFPLPTQWFNTSVDVTANGTTKSALILGVNQYQVNAILPSTVLIGSASLTVTYNGATSAPVSFQVVAAAFGIYTYGSSGIGQAIATDPAYVINTVIHTFHPGDVGIIWGTGLGAIATDDSLPPPVANLPGQAQVYVGNSAAQVIYHGRSGCCAGLDQISFRVPEGVDGCYVPLSVQTDGGISNFTTIAVSASGSSCTDSILGQDLLAKLAAGQDVSFGYLRLEDGFLKFIQGSPQASNQDLATATFSKITPATAGLAEYGVSAGYCMAVACPGFRCAVNGAFGLEDLSPAQLDAGSALTATWGTPLQMPDAYSGSGLYFALLSLNTRFLWSQELYNIGGPGGADVGSFSVNDKTGNATALITNLQPVQALPRTSDLVVQWSGADTTKQNGQVVVAGYSGNNSNYDLLTYFQCTASGAAGQLTIPARVLSMLPASGTGQNQSLSYPLGWIWVGQWNNPTTFSATGLDRGIITDAFYNGFGVYFQ